MVIDGSAWKSNTIDSYRNLLRRHLLPTFGPRPITAITVEAVESWWAALCRQDYSRKHLSNARAVLTGILQRAVTSGLLTQNPAGAIAGRIGREDREVRQADWLTEAELSQILRVAETREPRYYPHLLTLASTGLRGSARGWASSSRMWTSRGRRSACAGASGSTGWAARRAAIPVGVM